MPAQAAAPLKPALRVTLVWALALGGGVMYGMHVLDTALAPLAAVSTIPWLLVALHPRLQGRGNLLAACAGLHLMSLVGVEWLRGHSTSAWLVAPLLYWPLFLPAWFLLRAVRARRPGIPLALAWPVIFTGVEWLRVRLSPGELAACVLGHSQIGLTRMVQVADLAGVAAVTFWLAALAGLGADILIVVTSGDPARLRARFLPQAASVAALLLAVFAYGWFRDVESSFTEGPRLHVLQPNTPVPDDRDGARRIHDLHVLQTLSSSRPDCDLIVWPENSIRYPYATDDALDPAFVPDLLRVSARIGQPILADGWRELPSQGGSAHSAILVRPDGTMQSSDKVRLLPWTEVVPGRSLAAALGDGVLASWERFIERFTGVVPRGLPGRLEDLEPMTFRGQDGREWRFGVPSCFEIATARVVNQWHRKGVDFLVNPTSEGRLGDSVHETTIALSGFRAIEGRVSVVRAGNDGISVLIDPSGRPREMLLGRQTGSPINDAGVFWPQVLLDARRPTVYARIGDAFAIACLLVALALVLPWRRQSTASAAPTATA